LSMRKADCVKTYFTVISSILLQKKFGQETVKYSIPRPFQRGFIAASTLALAYASVMPESIA
ncbi:MAG: hypothetical protein J6Z36_01940, partial [Clostridia bacterium]|nr:hypothetical protein [Clostridia bacterium]